MPDPFLEYVKDEPIEQQRYLTLKDTLSSFCDLFRDRRVLDFGASYGLSICALLQLGAGEVVGVEPDELRVRRGRKILENIGYNGRGSLHHVRDTTQLPLEDGSFDVVIANAVLEHIPQPRLRYVEQLWRVLKTGGHFIVNETPNKYLPIDFHTTGLFLVPWLPSRIARRYAIFRGRFSAEDDWSTSGWRGVGYYELTKGLYSPYDYFPENSRRRHRILSWLGLPASLIDPYPILVFRKH